MVITFDIIASRCAKVWRRSLQMLTYPSIVVAGNQTTGFFFRQGHNVPSQFMSRSDEFNDFLRACLVKNPDRRPDADYLLRRVSFSTGNFI